jgi:hypothetical protein
MPIAVVGDAAQHNPYLVGRECLELLGPSRHTIDK